MKYPNLIFINQLIDDYVNNRLEQAPNLANVVSNTLTKLTGFGENNTLESITTTRIAIEEKLSVAGNINLNPLQHAKLWVDVLILLGQKAGEHAPNRSHILFHAIRSYILLCADEFPELKQVIDIEIANRKTKLDSTQVESERKTVLRELVYLGDISKITAYKLEDLFPKESSVALMGHKNFITSYVENKYHAGLDKTINQIIDQHCKRYALHKDYITKAYEYNPEDYVEEKIITPKIQPLAATTSIMDMLNLNKPAKGLVTKASDSSNSSESHEDNTAEMKETNFQTETVTLQAPIEPFHDNNTHNILSDKTAEIVVDATTDTVTVTELPTTKDVVSTATMGVFKAPANTAPTNNQNHNSKKSRNKK